MIDASSKTRTMSDIEEQEFIQMMTAKLPPVIARKEIKTFLGGIVSHQKLANADASGVGPEVAYRIGRGVAYRTDSLLTWLVKNYGVSRIAHVNTL